MGKLSRASIIPLPDGATSLDVGNVEPGHSALYCRFDLLGRAPVDLRRPLGGPDIGYRIEMTR